MFKKLNVNAQAQSQVQVKPLIEYLKEQNALLDEIGRLLTQENRALTSRDAEKITALTERKAQLMVTLQGNDQKIKLHPDAARLKTDYTQHVRVLRVKLAECKRRNEVNGKLIRLCQASCRRLTSMLMGVRDRMTQSLTYTDKGGMNARQLQRVNISA